jgi:hypothetical protein
MCAKAGIQPWDKAGKPLKAAQSKPCSVVVFWMLAFASMTQVRQARLVFDFHR